MEKTFYPFSHLKVKAKFHSSPSQLPQDDFFYSVHKTHLGDIVTVTTPNSLIGLAFKKRWSLSKPIAKSLFKQCPSIQRDTHKNDAIEKLLSVDSEMQTIQIEMQGTPFQIDVWQTLLLLTPGKVVSYEDISQQVGRPKAVRAVANAVGANPIAVVVPCHRVIHKSGDIHGYRWGKPFKQALLEWEREL